MADFTQTITTAYAADGAALDLGRGVHDGAVFTVSLPLGGLDDGGHGADQVPESLDRPGVAGEVDLGV